VREERLPYAFYGLTYLPLLVVLTAAGRLADRWENRLFGRPVRLFSISLSYLLLAASLGHAKAMFPVASVMVVMFGAQAVCFRRSALAIPAVVAWLIAAYGAVPFLNAVLQLSLPPTASLICLTGAAASLLVPGYWIDRRLRTLDVTQELSG